jgi:iron complex outermembrane receptor protein
MRAKNGKQRCAFPFLRVKEAVFALNFNNVFDSHYATGGWVYSAILSGSHPNDNRYYQIGFMPMAGFTMMGNVTLRF